MTIPATERFWAKVQKGPGCWLWMASLDSKGYGQFRVSTTRKIVAHRFAYEALVGAIPDGMQLDHLCRVRNCVNPDHLEPVTSQINTLRGQGPTAGHARKTHCPQNHPYDEQNTRIDASGRHCRACEQDRSTRRRSAADFGGGPACP